MDGTFKCTPKKPKVQQFYVLGGMIGKTVGSYYFMKSFSLEKKKRFVNFTLFLVYSHCLHSDGKKD